MRIKCYEKLKVCMRKGKKTRKIWLSKKCPYELALETMTQGMHIAIMLSQVGIGAWTFFGRYSIYTLLD
jgi:hypothetical protein